MTGTENLSPIAADLLNQIDASRDELIETTRKLVSLPSETPPSDTRAVADAVAELLAPVAHIETTIHTSEPPIANLVAIVHAETPGKRLVLNGHLDTYPTGDPASWSDDPFSGAVRDGKLFGRGSGDMKGGIAGALLAFKILAQHRDAWTGELVMALAGDEESMGRLGTQYLIDNVPEACGDAMLCADVGSPLVPRVGEKGMIWIDVFATGKPAHGAHVHRGVNAIDALRRAMDALATLNEYPVVTPDEISRTIAAAKPISEPLGGDGEAEILRRITVNFGRIEGGQTANLVADRAELNADIRLPMGVTVGEIEEAIGRLLDPIDGVRFHITRRYEPSWTAPDDPIVEAALQSCEQVLGKPAVINMRVGASDARLYRAAAIPTVVCGLTPHNLGGPDEYAVLDELVDVAKIQLLTALHFLSPR